MHFRPFPVFLAYVFLSGKSADPKIPLIFFFETFPYLQNPRKSIKKKLEQGVIKGLKQISLTASQTQKKIITKGSTVPKR